MESGSSLPRSQKPAIDLYFYPNEFNPYPPTQSLYDPVLILSSLLHLGHKILNFSQAKQYLTV